jgi:hypothetical protein
MYVYILYTNIHTHTHTQIYTHRHIGVHTYAHTYMNAYIHRHTHTHTCTQTHTQFDINMPSTRTCHPRTGPEGKVLDTPAAEISPTWNSILLYRLDQDRPVYTAVEEVILVFICLLCQGREFSICFARFNMCTKVYNWQQAICI